jgi:hypothetical protein
MELSNILKLADQFYFKTSLGQEDMGIDLSKELTSIVNEMEGDLLALRMKDYPEPQWKELVQLFYQLVRLNKEVSGHNMTESVLRIINFILHPDTQERLHRMQSDIDHFLQENQIDFGKHKLLSQVSVNSLTKLLNLPSKLSRQDFLP